MRLVTTAMLLSLLTGCVVKVPQYEAAKGFVGQFWASGSAQDERLFLWTARIGDEGRLLRLHQEQGFSCLPAKRAMQWLSMAGRCAP